MKIVIIGSGKLGRTLAEQLIQEDHDITMVDENASKLQYVVNRLDILGIHGNGATIPVLREAGVDDADLVIAATAEDELNLLACLIAKRVGARNTIARVRNPEYIDVSGKAGSRTQSVHQSGTGMRCGDVASPEISVDDYGGHLC